MGSEFAGTLDEHRGLLLDPDVRLGPLDLQMADLEIDTPDDLYQSGNSIYACCAFSGLSISC